MPTLTQRLVPQALLRGEFMNRAGQAGPRRLIVIAGIGVGMAALVTGAMLIGTQGAPVAGPMKTPPQADPNRHLRPMISPPPFPKASHTGRRVGSADKADCIVLSVSQSME